MILFKQYNNQNKQTTKAFIINILQLIVATEGVRSELHRQKIPQCHGELRRARTEWKRKRR